MRGTSLFSGASSSGGDKVWGGAGAARGGWARWRVQRKFHELIYCGWGPVAPAPARRPEPARRISVARNSQLESANRLKTEVASLCLGRRARGPPPPPPRRRGLPPAPGPRAPGDGLSAPHLSPGAPRRGGGAEALRGPRPRAHLHVVVLEGCSVRCGDWGGRSARGSPRQDDIGKAYWILKTASGEERRQRLQGRPSPQPQRSSRAFGSRPRELQLEGGHPASPGSGTTRASTTGPSRSSARRTTRAACWRRARSRRSSPSTGRSTCGRRGRR